jgi:dTDP-glucose 4,6-dehydratase
MPPTPQHVLVTGGAGFIGSHVVDALLAVPGTRVSVLDRLSAGGTRTNLEAHDGDPRLVLVVGDVNDAAAVDGLVGEADAVIHAAAESHVDRSIDDARPFLEANLLGTQCVLDAVRRHGRRMLMVSTDEVYGPGEAAGGVFAEDAPLRPRSPYAASKAAADLLCQAYVATYGVDVTVVRGTNAFGPRQIERVVPTYAVCALEGRPVPVYGEGRQRREFLFVEDWVEGALTALREGEAGVVYNIGAGVELENLDLARRICELAGADPSLIMLVPDRPGHDFRYGVAADRLLALGWRPTTSFDEGLARTVTWYGEHL